MTVIDQVPEALHIGSSDLPWVETGRGNKLRVLHVKHGEGLWITESIFEAGFTVPTHRHTGPVWGYTVSGSWKYKEYDYINRAGSFLYEPAGSVHTLESLEDNTQVWFHMYGANLNLDSNGDVVDIIVGMGTLTSYLQMCKAQGFDEPNVITQA